MGVNVFTLHYLVSIDDCNKDKRKWVQYNPIGNWCVREARGTIKIENHDGKLSLTEKGEGIEQYRKVLWLFL